MPKIKIAIIGTGQIGTDLLYKLMDLDFVEIVAFVGRRPNTKQLPNNIFYTYKSIEYFIVNQKCCDVVFDCTDAYSAKIHADIFFNQNIKVIDLTPSNIGDFYIPTLNCAIGQNINMVTCGGQASIPLLKYIKNKLNDAFIYTEVITQINSKTAGIATRINIDKYIDTTEKAIYKFIDIPKCKVMLNINPNIDTVMQTTIFIKTHKMIDIFIFDDLHNFINRIQTYIPNYTISNPVWRENNIIMFNIKVLGSNFLSKNAGNLDIINCAAVHALTTIYNSNV